MVDRPGVQLRLRLANRLEGRGPQAERAVKFARACIETWGMGQVGCSLEVLAAPPSHAGLGSGTQLGLAVAAGIRHLFSEPPGDAGDEAAGPESLDATEHDWLFDIRDVMDLARVVGRGRRSCVGVYGFSRGGLIVEAGRIVDETSGTEEEQKRSFSPMIARARLPAAWRCVVIVGRESAGLSGDAEREAFKRIPPVPAEVTAELSRIALVELLPAAVEGRFGEFAAAVRRYGTVAGQPFAAESARLPHAAATAHLLELLAEVGAPGSAQSSWGPAVMACVPSL